MTLSAYQVIMQAASSGKRNVTVWCSSVRLSVCPVDILAITHQGQHVTLNRSLTVDHHLPKAASKLRNKNKVSP